MSSKTEVMRLKDVRVIDSPMTSLSVYPTFVPTICFADVMIKSLTIRLSTGSGGRIDSFVENDLWLRVNMICAIGQIHNFLSGRRKPTPVGSRRQFDPRGGTS